MKINFPWFLIYTVVVFIAVCCVEDLYYVYRKDHPVAVHSIPQQVKAKIIRKSSNLGYEDYKETVESIKGKQCQPQ